MLKEARVFDVRSSPDRLSFGLRVLVMRQWPRGISRECVDVWMPDAGPSDALLAEYRAGLVSWSEFEQRYKTEQEAQQACRIVRYDGDSKVSDDVVPCSPVAVLQVFEDIHSTVTVMCWEDSECCHRFILPGLCEVSHGC
jgi:uncharacterized protein YeaO (DUF488 family)